MKETAKNIKAIDIEELDGTLTMKFLLPLTISNASAYGKSGDFKKSAEGKNTVKIDLSAIEVYDSFLVVYINSIKKVCATIGIEIEIVGMNEDIARFLDILTPKEMVKLPKDKRSFFVRYHEFIGNIVISVAKDTYSFIEFVGDMIGKFSLLPFRPSSMRWKDFPHHFIKSGVNAIPITLLIVFLLGVITGYQGALQLAQFGADRFIAALIGISITRELSPLMVAILVAGRSGSAFAAEIGTMKVGEEVDALSSMGFAPIPFLVLPRVLAVVIAMPLLTIICDIAGVAGGLIAAISTLEVTVSSYINELQVSVTGWDVVTGIIKSMVFGGLIATVGCFRGLQVSGGAESVGRYTTASVVTGIFLIILSDSMFTFLFHSLGI